MLAILACGDSAVVPRELRAGWHAELRQRGRMPDVRGSQDWRSTIRARSATAPRTVRALYRLMRYLAQFKPVDSRERLAWESRLLKEVARTDPRLDDAVGWQPQVHEIGARPGNRVLFTTDRRPLIAQMWFARADFAKAHPEIIEGIARTLDDATASLATLDQRVLDKLVTDAFAIERGVLAGMLSDVRFAAPSESREFLLASDGATSLAALFQLSAR